MSYSFSPGGFIPRAPQPEPPPDRSWLTIEPVRTTPRIVTLRDRAQTSILATDSDRRLGDLRWNLFIIRLAIVVAMWLLPAIGIWTPWILGQLLTTSLLLLGPFAVAAILDRHVASEQDRRAAGARNRLTRTPQPRCTKCGHMPTPDESTYR